jgi:ankyrin repeat protein
MYQLRSWVRSFHAWACVAWVCVLCSDAVALSLKYDLLRAVVSGDVSSAERVLMPDAGVDTAALMRYEFTKADISEALDRSVAAVVPAGCPILIVAVIGGDADMARLLVERGADANAHSTQCLPAIYYALLDRNLEVADAVLSASAATAPPGVNFTLMAPAGSPHAQHALSIPILWAPGTSAQLAGEEYTTSDGTDYGRLPDSDSHAVWTPGLELLLGHGADPNARNARSGATPLHDLLAQSDSSSEHQMYIDTSMFLLLSQVLIIHVSYY